MLNVKGNKIFNSDLKETQLKGFCIGSWLMLENFMMGYPGVEQHLRYYMEKYGGTDKNNYFFEKLMDKFIIEDDIAFIKSMGCNVVRLPFNYRLFESDLHPFKYCDKAFIHIDRLVDLCKKHGMYVILDMHAAPGYQNADWHSDNYTGEARLYREANYQQRTVELWKYIANRYKNEDTIAGYDLLNEPVALTNEDAMMLNKIYRDIAKAIREVDKKHIIFLKGNMWGQTFDTFEEPFEDKLAYSCHFYTEPGLMQIEYPNNSLGKDSCSKEMLEKAMDSRDSFMRKNNVPCWVGEFGTIESDPCFTASKEKIIIDQLDIFNERGHSWTVWSYKDVGNMGTVHLDPKSPWMQFIDYNRGLKSKYHSEFDPINGDNWKLADIIKPYYESDFKEDTNAIDKTIKSTLAGVFSTLLTERFAKKLAVLSYNDLDSLIDSFEFGNCLIRTNWKKIIGDRT